MRTIAIVLGVFAVAGGLLAAWLLWWEPRQARAHSRAQVTAWEERWLPARACVLGDEPLAADPADALAMRELSTGSMKATNCTDLIGAITRPEGGGMASQAVERAFLEVEAAIPAVAKAYAFRLSAEPDQIDLGIAIAALDGAHDRLRAAAGMEPLARGGAASLRRLGDPVSLAPLTASARVQAGVVTQEQLGSQRAITIATGPTAIRTLRWAVEAVASLPGATWMVAALPAETGIAVAAMPVADTVDFAAAVPVVEVGAPFVPVGALGDGDTRVVILVPDTGLDPLPEGTRTFTLAVSTDAGKTWTLGDSAPSPDLFLYAEPDYVTGVLDIVVGADDDYYEQPLGRYRFDPAEPTKVPLLVSTPGLARGDACRRGDAAWWIPDETAQVHHLDGSVLVPATNGALRLADCTADSALVEEATVPVRYHRCDRSACREAFRGATYAFGRAAMKDDGSVVYAAGRGAILALWTESSTEPTYSKLPRALTLDALVVWSGAVHALLHDPKDKSATLLALPLE